MTSVSSDDRHDVDIDIDDDGGGVLSASAPAVVVSAATDVAESPMARYFDANDDGEEENEDENEGAGEEEGGGGDPPLVACPSSPPSTTTTTTTTTTKTPMTTTTITPGESEGEVASTGGGSHHPASTVTPVVVDDAASAATTTGSGGEGRGDVLVPIPTVGSGTTTSTDRIVALSDVITDDDDDDDESSSLSPGALLEAERQAAIAAAVSANYCPGTRRNVSVGGGIGVGGGGLGAAGGVGGGGGPTTMIISSSSSSSSLSVTSSMGGMGMSPSAAAALARSAREAPAPHPIPPPPPPPRDDDGRRRRAVGNVVGPTIVALPPIASAMPGPYRLPTSLSSAAPRRRSAPATPVAFDDVRDAFRDRLASSSSSSSITARDRTRDGSRDAVGGTGEGASADGGGRGTTSASSAEVNVDVGSSATSEEVKANEDVGGEGGGAESSSGGDATATGMAVVPSSPIADSDDAGGDVENDDEKSKSSSSSAATAAAAAAAAADVARDHARTVPDSFLKFLLHVARVPLIDEEKSPTEDDEGRNRNDGDGSRKSPERTADSPSLTAARAASQRAYEILCMVRSSYEMISEEQERTSRDAGRTDATQSFFAACEGSKVADADNPAGDLNPTKAMIKERDDAVDSPVNSQSDYRDRELFSKGGSNTNLPPPPPSPPMSSSSSTASMTTASSMASSVFSNVISKMIIPKKQPSFADMGKKLVSGAGASAGQQQPSQPKDGASQQRRWGDYEVLINNEMLGLTVENVLERTIIRTLLPDGAARHAGAQVGSLVAKVGNIDTSNLTHFETIDELRRSQRPLKLTLRHVGGDVLRKAREEMGRLIRGQGLATVAVGGHDVVDGRPWKGSNPNQQHRERGPSFPGETFDSVLNNRWPSKLNKSSSAPPNSLAMMREEGMQQAGKKLIRILALLVVGLMKELNSLNDNVEECAMDGNSGGSIGARRRSHLSMKELSEAIGISSKILLDFVSCLPDVGSSIGASDSNSARERQEASSFYPVPPGRVQGKKRGPHPPNAGRGNKAQRSKKHPASSPLLRIGEALQRSRSFLVEFSSVTATALRWEIIDYLCMVLDLDTEQELSENEDDSLATSNGGDAGSPLTDLGAAGSILKLIVLNCSTIASEGATLIGDIFEQSQQGDGESESSSLAGSSGIATSTSTSGNSFLSVVHRLAASKSISARVSACSLGTVLWSHIDFPRQLQLRGVLTRALHDVEVMVRKSTAVVLHEIAELIFDRRAVPWLVLMCERSMTDPEPQLRAAAMTLTWHLAEHLPNAFLGDASKGSRSIRRLPPRDSSTFMDVYLLQCKLFPVASNLAEDRVASVRLSVAAQCDRLCNALGEHWSSVIIDLLQSLLSDSDDLVRSEAVLCIPRLVESVVVGTPDSHRSIAVLESLLPLALKIQKDTSSLVRSSLATATGELLIFLVGLGGVSSSHSDSPSSPGIPPPSPGRSGTTYTEHKKYVDDTLIPILQKLLQDSDPEVVTASLRAVTNASRSGTAREASSTRIPSGSQSALIDDDLVSLSSHQSHHSHTSFERTKPVFIPVLSEKQVLRLLPTLSNLGTSPQWRVRQSAVEIVPALMGCTRRHETRHEISKLCLRLMNDKVDAVRKTAAECFCLGGSSLARHGEEDGGEWMNTIVIPHLRTCSMSDDGKQRLLSLKMIEIIVTNGLCPTSRSGTEVDNSSPQWPMRDDESVSVSSSVTESERPVRIILNIAASLTSDKVANVRLNVGRTFVAIMSFLDRSDIDFAVETLEKQLDEETARSGGGDRDVIYFSHEAISMAKPLRHQLRRMPSNISSG